MSKILRNLRKRCVANTFVPFTLIKNIILKRALKITLFSIDSNNFMNCYDSFKFSRNSPVIITIYTYLNLTLIALILFS